MRSRCAVGLTPWPRSRWFRFSTRPGSRSDIGMGASIRADIRPAMRNGTNTARFAGLSAHASAPQNSPMRTIRGQPGITLHRAVRRPGARRPARGPGRARFRASLRDAAVRAATYELLAGLQQAARHVHRRVAARRAVPRRRGGQLPRPRRRRRSSWRAFLEAGGAPRPVGRARPAGRRHGCAPRARRIRFSARCARREHRPP